MTPGQLRQAPSLHLTSLGDEPFGKGKEDTELTLTPSAMIWRRKGHSLCFADAETTESRGTRMGAEDWGLEVQLGRNQ